jgi:signal transduction histidine kinase
MENHADRPEIKEARRQEWGASVRHSTTPGEDLLYVAHRNPTAIVRVAYSLAEIREQLLHLWFKALLFFAVVLGVIFWLSVRLNRRIDADAQRIHTSLERILAKHYDDDMVSVECCQEFAEIRRLIGKLARKLAKRQRQKEKHTRKLKALTQRQSDIISAISHEFKNPVAAIMGYAQSLEEMRDLDPAMQRRFIEKIHANAEKISRMIDRLSLAVKLESSTFSPRLTRFELHAVAENARELLQQRYAGRRIRLECDEVRLFADRDMIEQVLVNLVENALKYSEGEVLIRCGEDRVDVIDHGEGIDSEELEKITRRFYRIDRLSWNNSIGVGLYIVKYILKLHNTELEIKSEASRGSTFGFSLEAMRA